MNLDKVPSTLEDAIDMIIADLTEDDLDYLENNKSTTIHLSYGRYIRNIWSLWDSETVLVQHFLNRFDIGHADDISGIILECVWRKVNSVDLDVESQVKKYHEHWTKLGLPRNGIQK